MRISVIYEVNGASKSQDFHEIRSKLLGPLATGTDQANYQLNAEGLDLRLTLVESEIKDEQLRERATVRAYGLQQFTPAERAMADALDETRDELQKAEQQLAAAQAALLQVRTILGNSLAQKFAELDATTDYKLGEWIDSQKEQPTDALRAFVLGLLPGKQAKGWPSNPLSGEWNACLDEIRANLDRALEGKP